MKTKLLMVLFAICLIHNSVASPTDSSSENGDEQQEEHPPLPERTYTPSYSNHSERESYERQWKAKQFPEPTTSAYWRHTPIYSFAIRKLLIDRTEFRFSVRLLKLGSFSPEVFYSMRQEKTGQFLVERVAPTKAMIWGPSRDADTTEEVLDYDFGIKVQEYPIDSVLAYELVGLWADMLENVSYQRDDSGMITLDGISYYYAARHLSLGVIEGESSNPRSDSIVARATQLGSESLSDRKSQIEIKELIESIKELRKEIYLVSRVSKFQ